MTDDDVVKFKRYRKWCTHCNHENGNDYCKECILSDDDENPRPSNFETDEDNFVSPNITKFNVEDPFNEGNRLTGWIHRTGKKKYGMLEIETVNGKDCPQTVWATPKMSYPMTIEGEFNNIPVFDKILCYTKYDGTNVLAFKYHDADGNDYITYKTRLSPIIPISHKYNDFYGMWNDMLERYPDIPALVEKNGCNMAFELYGLRNFVLIKYDVTLDCVLLYGVDPEEGTIIPTENLDSGTAPSAKLLEEITGSISDAEFIEKYVKMQEKVDKELVITYADKENEKIEDIEGIEGAVWYAVNGDDCKQIKCKPQTIMDLQRAESAGIPIHSIITTIYNAFEIEDPPSFDTVKELLLEEFSEQNVEKKSEKIKKLICDMVTMRRLKEELADEYLDKKFDIVNERSECMKYFGKKYGKSYSGKVFRLLMDNFAGDFACADCGKMFNYSRMTKGRNSLVCKACGRKQLSNKNRARGKVDSMLVTLKNAKKEMPENEDAIQQFFEALFLAVDSLHTDDYLTDDIMTAVLDISEEINNYQELYLKDDTTHKELLKELNKIILNVEKLRRKIK